MHDKQYQTIRLWNGAHTTTRETTPRQINVPLKLHPQAVLQNFYKTELALL